MHLRSVGIALIAVLGLATGFPRKTMAGEPGACQSDTKLVNDGPTLVDGEGPGTWWGLTIDGLDAAGLTTDAEKIAWLNLCFGTSFTNLDDLRDHNIKQIAPFDKNQ